MASIDRRKFIAGAALAGVTVYLAGWWAIKVRPRDDSQLVLAILSKHLGRLRVREGDFERFAEEFRVHHRSSALRSWAGIATPIYRWSSVERLLPARSRFRRFEERVVGTFLLSTDFFWRDADESAELTYLGYYDPQLRPCQNPCARLI